MDLKAATIHGLLAAGLMLQAGAALAASRPVIPVPKAAHQKQAGVPMPKEVHAKLRPVAADIKAMVPFDAAPFPFDGPKPNEGAFLNIMAGSRRGHMTGHGITYWEDTTYNDNRVLVYIPKGFDVRKPAVMVVFFHGNGAKLERDVAARQQVPRQVAQSGLNAILVAPQFAVDAVDSAAGSFWQPGTFRQFLDEATTRLTDLYGDPRTRKVFSALPIVLVAYSGGYQPAAYVLEGGGADKRLKGVFLMDAVYGETGRFAEWAIRRRDAFFVSSFTGSSAGGNGELQRLLGQRQITIRRDLPDKLGKGTVAFVPAMPDAVHGDFVTHAFADDPIKEILLRLPQFAHKPGAVKSRYVSPASQLQVTATRTAPDTPQ